MAEAPIKAAVDSCIGSLITLTTKSGMRYEGSLLRVDAQECTIALQHVKSFGTEGRRGVFVVSPSDKIYTHVVFQGSDIKDLRVISSPSYPQSIPSVLDDPAIIESRDSLPPPMHTGLATTTTSVNGNESARPLRSYLPGLIGYCWEQVSQTQPHNFPPLQHHYSGVNASITFAELNRPSNQPPVCITKEAAASILGSMNSIIP